MANRPLARTFSTPSPLRTWPGNGALPPLIHSPITQHEHTQCTLSLENTLFLDQTTIPAFPRRTPSRSSSQCFARVQRGRKFLSAILSVVQSFVDIESTTISRSGEEGGASARVREVKLSRSTRPSPPSHPLDPFACLHRRTQPLRRRPHPSLYVGLSNLANPLVLTPHQAQEPIGRRPWLTRPRT